MYILDVGSKLLYTFDIKIIACKVVLGKIYYTANYLSLMLFETTAKCLGLFKGLARVISDVSWLCSQEYFHILHIQKRISCRKF